MRKYLKSAELRIRSSVLLLAILGNLIFSAVFVLSTGVHVIKSGSSAQQTVQAEKEPVKEQKLVTLAQIN